MTPALDSADDDPDPRDCDHEDVVRYGRTDMAGVPFIEERCKRCNRWLDDRRATA